MKQNISAGTVIRTAVLAFALVNQMLTILGKNPLPWTNEQFEQIAGWAITVCAAIAAWWKNNSFTQAAINADKILAREKKK